MTQKKILLLSVSAGAGHMRAAEALRSHADLLGDGVSATHVDVMDFVTPGFRKMYTDFYIKLVNKAPTLWGYLYQATHEAKPDSSMERLRRGLERLNTSALLREIKRVQPDVIICTHFLPAEILSRLAAKTGFSTPVWVQVTDFDLHRMWVHEHMAGYFAANDEVAFRMRAQGIAAARIAVTGIPIMPVFGAPPARAVCAAEFGLDPARPTILLMGGGAGLGSLDTIAARLLALDGNFQLIVLAGKNAAALAALQALAPAHPGRLLALGFTDKVERLMAGADLVITKPGGLTTSECLAMGVPMIVNAPIPGQEERNADFLLEQGVALKAFDAVTLEYRVRYLLEHPAKLADMREKARALGRPGAAAAVLARVLGEDDGAGAVAGAGAVGAVASTAAAGAAAAASTAATGGAAS
nr:glycosyltransferase [uncultured Duganella sp.]